MKNEDNLILQKAKIKVYVYSTYKAKKYIK